MVERRVSGDCPIFRFVESGLPTRADRKHGTVPLGGCAPLAVALLRDPRELAYGGLTIDAPQDALTPDLLNRLKAQKADLLALLLLPAPDAATARPVAARDTQATPAKPVCRCGSTTWRDVPIHGGQSFRRDCSRCGRFLDFPVWHGRNTLQNET